MTGPISIIQAAITCPELISDPLRLYKLACRYSWKPEMQLSARLALKFDFTHPDVIGRLNGIDFADFARLLGLVRRRRDMFESRLNSHEDFNGSRYVYRQAQPFDPYSTLIKSYLCVSHMRNRRS